MACRCAEVEKKNRSALKSCFTYIATFRQATRYLTFSPRFRAFYSSLPVYTVVIGGRSRDVYLPQKGIYAISHGRWWLRQILT